MLRIQTDNLVPDEQQRVHADFLANERDYLRLRDALLAQYRGQWVAVDGGRVIASGSNILGVTEAAAQSGGHPYIALVGAENETVFRVRQTTFRYDQQYQPFALPRLTATFWNLAATHSHTSGDVIPDTGADLSVLPDSDCFALDLYNSPYLTGLTSGVLGPASTTLIYRGMVEIDNKRYAALIQPVPNGREKIVGRDVLNQQRILFDGPAALVIIEP